MLKQLNTILLILAMVVFTGCSEVEENTDPVLGIWAKTRSTSTEGSTITKEEWIFNDAYLGRYNAYEGSEITIRTDFQWEKVDGMYTILYPGINKSDQKARRLVIEEKEVLQDMSGVVLAIRQ